MPCTCGGHADEGDDDRVDGYSEYWDTDDEAIAARRLRADSVNAWRQPSRATRPATTQTAAPRADDIDEEAAKRALREQSENAWRTPSARSK